MLVVTTLMSLIVNSEKFPLPGSTDNLTVHVPLDDSNWHLIGQDELAALPPHSIMINCACGGVIDQQAIANAVKTGEMAATDTDVFAVEPPAKDKHFMSCRNSIVNPHNAACTAEGLCRMATFSAQNTIDQFDRKLTADKLINPEVFEKP